MKKRFLFPAVLLLIACEGGPTPNIVDFEECILAGYPIMESQPRRCSVPGGPSFVEELPPLAVSDLRNFEGVFMAVEPVADDGSLFFTFYTDEGTERSVLEPDAQIIGASLAKPVDVRSISSGTLLSVHGWRDDDGLVHAVVVIVRE